MSKPIREYRFQFGLFASQVLIQEALPEFEELRRLLFPDPPHPPLCFVCDAHTEALARRIRGNQASPCCVLPPGEEAKTWASVERILKTALDAGLGRDAFFVAVGGGVVSDLTAFAASVYMRGGRLCLIPTTLLGMADAALGGKTGIDLFGIKNLAGTFYPASLICLSLESLASLPKGEWKSGMAELIKAAILEEDGTLFARMRALKDGMARGSVFDGGGGLLEALARAVEIKGRIVEADPRETGSQRALLNLGHTFGHALEASAGLGRVSHGEAVAWGMVRAGALGRALGITPADRERAVRELILAYGYETRSPHPLMGDKKGFMRALGGDKKKKDGKAVFVVPAERGARLIALDLRDPRAQSLW
ncbi:MAG: 3-dehydroquinate synthase [Treponema sp.]|nr:3-dehydroquinate synthase [Treponema sp.]